MLNLGDLVTSSAFSGIGKLTRLEETESTVQVAFFESPENPEARAIELDKAIVVLASLFDERVIYCIHPVSKTWARARYGGNYDDGTHLVIFRRGEQTTAHLSEIYVPNLPEGIYPNASEYLSQRANDTPLFSEWRLPFLRAYIKQRAACRSISSIPSSSVELEPHQLAVVRRVLQDPVKKYLLADEVGLGKTIEAGLLIREHILEEGKNARVLVACPPSLISQWREELSSKFHLRASLTHDSESGPILEICSFDILHSALSSHTKLTMLVVDEAHQVSPLAWSDDFRKRQFFSEVANACWGADSCLLLSGTPLLGNEKNYLSMLNCLSPEAFEINQEGVDRFRELTLNREELGGIYSALTVDNDNETLLEVLEDLHALIPDDSDLNHQIIELREILISNDESSEERELGIKKLRAYIGNHHRIFHRLLRNRRVDPRVASLFPGLGGLHLRQWRLESQKRGLDDMLEEYRDLHKHDPSSYPNFVDFLDWLDLYFESPGSVAYHIDNLLNLSGTNDDEEELLKHIANAAADEELAKHKCLSEALDEWLGHNPDGKAVVFCGNGKLANEVYNSLTSNLRVDVVLHKPSQCTEFNDHVSTRILVCDEQCEDGLNLHGKSRLAVHYGLPRSLARIEQRNGRFNRYAAQISANPVEILALIPAYGGIYAEWINLLNDTIGIFDETIASLQFVLEKHLAKTWHRISSGDHESNFELSTQVLQGSGGKLNREKNRIRNLEQLNSLEEEVEDANSFAEIIVAQDEDATKQAKPMLNWMTNGLQFLRKGDPQQIFTLKFKYDGPGGRTLLDVPTFLDHCVEGIDFENSDYRAPQTHPMSANRLVATQAGHVYPFRFGQPFVDTVYRLSLQDPRGVSSVRLRLIKEFNEPEPRLFFRLHWLVEAIDSNEPLWLKRIGDEWRHPSFVTHYLDEFGEIMEEDIKALLRVPYNTEPGGGYQDLSIRAERWKLLGEWDNDRLWSTTVNKVTSHSLEQLQSQVITHWTNRPPNLPGSSHQQLVSIEAFFLTSPLWLSKVMHKLRERPS